jgi:hypothetical protein
VRSTTTRWAPSARLFFSSCPAFWMEVAMLVPPFMRTCSAGQQQRALVSGAARAPPGAPPPLRSA